MKAQPPSNRNPRGISLVEAVLSMAVLAIAAPLAIAALIRGGETAAAAGMESRAPAIVEHCLAEITSARAAGSPHLPKLLPGQAFGIEEILSLAFRRDGSLIGPASSADYEAGLDGDAAFLVRLQGRSQPARPGFPALLRIDLSLEHPATAPRDRRRNKSFHTLLP